MDRVEIDVVLSRVDMVQLSKQELKRILLGDGENGVYRWDRQTEGRD